MFADALNLIIAKKNMKENWKIKERLYIKKDYCKLQIIENEGEITEIKEITKMEKIN